MGGPGVPPYAQGGTGVPPYLQGGTGTPYGQGAAGAPSYVQGGAGPPSYVPGAAGAPPYIQGADGQWQPQAPRSSRWDRLAICGFVLGLLGVLVIGPILSIVALRRIRRSGERGRGLAIAGLVLSGCWLAVAIAGLGFAAVAGGRADVGEITAISNIEVGQCFDADLTKRTLLVAKVADCTAAHGGETYAKVTADLSGLANNEQELTATQECGSSFETFVGIPYDESELDIFYVVLGERNVADGNIVCMLGLPGQRLTGSMRGTRR